MPSKLSPGRSIQNQLLGAVKEAIIATDLEGSIVYWNPFATNLYGWSADEVLGRNIMDVLVTSATKEQASRIMSLIRKGESWTGEFQVRRKDGTDFPAQVTDAPIFGENGEVIGVVGISRDLTQQKETEAALQESRVQLESIVEERTNSLRLLSARLLQMQDVERRRIARELHDSIGQYLAMIAMDIDLLSEQKEEAKRTNLIEECRESVRRCLSETRTLSHLLHPPLLDESGLVYAAQWYVEGFAKRSGIAVRLDLPPTHVRLPNDIEIVLFRIMQESLTNVHRHAKCSAVEITLKLVDKQAVLQIKDNGCGIPQGKLQLFRNSSGGVGVGLAGMRERVRDLNGQLEISSGLSGSTVLVTIPIVESAGTAAV